MCRPFHPLILRFDSLASTNTEAARQAARGASEGLCIVAREQTEGRGRRRREWVSPKDAGLYVSIVLRPRLEMRAWPLLTLMASLAVADALRDSCALAVDIKWPNDVLAGGRKICGILAEMLETETGRAGIVGIGINLTDNAFPPELRATATSVEAETGARPVVEDVLRSLLRAFGERYARLEGAGGAEAMLDEWMKHSSYATGKRVRVALDAEIFEGVTRGLAGDGALRVETFDGKIRTVHAGDVTAVREQ
ncbi:MAG TPA: biotin--[acetyl-CoA-carboxylase] ligase [Pyrinomonadaceae bacterium]|jgi:BirA family biotin operon repressor/biotin-[acetyl-CoA-carboxylase] ligase